MRKPIKCKRDEAEWHDHQVVADRDLNLLRLMGKVDRQLEDSFVISACVAKRLLKMHGESRTFAALISTIR